MSMRLLASGWEDIFLKRRRLETNGLIGEGRVRGPAQMFLVLWVDSYVF